MRAFSELSEQEILALAISLEEEDQRIYLDYAQGLAERYPASAKVFAAFEVVLGGLIVFAAGIIIGNA